MSRLYCETFGQGKPLVLVHGWSMHSGVWRDFAEQLALHYQVTCVDLPGHGRSKPIDEFTLAQISTQLAQVIPESACWLGWSLGCEVVLDFSRRFPEQVDGLILLAGNPCFVAQKNWPGMPVNDFSAFVSQIKKDAGVGFMRFLSLMGQGSNEFRQVSKMLKATVQQYDLPETKTMLAGLDILQQADLRQVVTKSQKPIMAILADNDALVPVAVGKAMQQINSNVQVVVIKNSAHVPFLSHPQQVLTSISRFMNNTL